MGEWNVKESSVVFSGDLYKIDMALSCERWFRALTEVKE